jgi:EAL domain-containing protein (putative c-di-GMP-specific phosphodiesterase class I)
MRDPGDAPPRMAVHGRVMLVDDEPIVLEVCTRVLRKAGFTVEPVTDPRCVSEVLERKPFDVVITDLSMAAMSGIDVLRAVRAKDSDIQVVLITGCGDFCSAVTAMEHGALRFLTKPVSASTLVTVAENAVALRHLATTKRRALAHYDELQLAERARADLDAQFDRAMASLRMVYQPIVRWSDRSIHAYEALLRTNERTLRTPDALFDAAARLGRVPEIGRAVRRHIARMLRAQRPEAPVFVNLHPLDLQDEDLWDANAPLSGVAGRVVLEITEHESLNGAGSVEARLAALRTLGYRLAVDDLGAGYAGFASLARLEPDVVKIDMSLTRRIDHSPARQTLVGTLVSMCRDLGIKTVIEGIETEDERDTLVGLGCDLMQGYLFARPAPSFPPVCWHDHAHLERPAV